MASAAFRPHRSTGDIDADHRTVGTREVGRRDEAVSWGVCAFRGCTLFGATLPGLFLQASRRESRARRIAGRRTPSSCIGCVVGDKTASSQRPANGAMSAPSNENDQARSKDTCGPAATSNKAENARTTSAISARAAPGGTRVDATDAADSVAAGRARVLEPNSKFIRVSITFKVGFGWRGTKSRDFPGRHFGKGDRDILHSWAKSFAKASLFYSHRSHQTNACSLYLKEPKGGNRS